MMTRIEKQLATTTASSSELAEAVKRRGRVVIDTDKLTTHAVGVLDNRLAKAVEPVAERVEQALVGFEQKVASVGSARVEEAMHQLAAVEDKAGEVVKAVRSAERRVEVLSARVTWTAVGRLALALLPLAAALLMVGGLVGGVAYAAGFGPLLGWAWASFAAAEAWWAKTLIALGTLAGFAAFGWVVWRLAIKLGDDFRHW